MGWVYLAFAGIFELGFTSFLKLSVGFTKLLPSIGFLIFSALSFWLLTKSLTTIPLGTAYAVWTGIGALGTAIIGMIFFKDPVSLGRVLFLAILIGSIVGLKIVSTT